MDAIRIGAIIFGITSMSASLIVFALGMLHGRRKRLAALREMAELNARIPQQRKTIIEGRANNLTPAALSEIERDLLKSEQLWDALIDFEAAARQKGKGNL